MWTKEPWGRVFNEETEEWENPKQFNRFIISNGHLSIEVHNTIDGSHGTGYIVSPKEAEAYADHILKKLNERDSINFRPRIPQEYKRNGYL